MAAGEAKITEALRIAPVTFAVGASLLAITEEEHTYRVMEAMVMSKSVSEWGQAGASLANRAGCCCKAALYWLRYLMSSPAQRKTVCNKRTSAYPFVQIVNW